MKKPTGNHHHRMMRSIMKTVWLISFLTTGLMLTGLHFSLTALDEACPDDVFFNAIYWIFLLILLLLLPAIQAVLIGRWIMRPFKEITNMATLIARGDFSKRLPSTQFIPLTPLVRIFNYMADEMEKLSHMNVSRILIEKKKTETILKNMVDGVIVTDQNMRVIILNRVAEKWFRLKEKNTLTKTLGESIKNATLTGMFDYVRKTHRDQHVEFSQSLVGAVNPHIFQAHGALIKDEHHHPIGIVSVIRDVTKEREAERVKNELVSMVAHEIKSPLTSIYGFSELLENMKPGEQDFREYVRVIMSESERLTDFVNKFLDLSRLESGRTTVRKEPFDIIDLVRRVVENHKSQSDKKKIQVVVDAQEGIPEILGDPGLIEQVVINLFSNALKYSPEHSKTGIEIKNTDSGVTVSVIDNGYGIPQEALKRIFDKFYRVSEAEESDETGSGLGLALVREIIERHGGGINVHSSLGVGSVFSFTLQNNEKSDG